jgi:hypothetical protein
MTIASYFLGFVLSSLMGFAFHLWKGGKIGRIVLYLVLSWIGFWGAQILGTTMELEFLGIGSLLVGLDIFGAVVVLFLGHWLSKVNTEEG